MVRRGSTVRVGQRASRIACTRSLSAGPRLAISADCSGKEHFLELPDSGGLSAAASGSPECLENAYKSGDL